TPTRRAVYRLGNQFRRIQSASDPNPPILLQCQVNAGMLFTDGYINDDNGGLPPVGNVDGTMGAPYSDGISDTMADIAAYSYVNNLRPDLPAGKVAVPAGCASGSPDPRLDCNANPHMNFYGIPLGARGQFFDAPPYVDNLATQADEATAAAFVTPPAWSAKGLANFVGGTTDLSPPAVDDLWHASMNTRGKFISAQSPAAVRNGIREVLNRVLDSTLGSGSIAGSGARVPGDNVAITVEPAFKVGNNGTDWTGELTGFRVNPDGTIGATAWTASSVLPLPGSRRLVTNILPGNSSTRVATDFNAANLGASNAAQLLKLGLTPLEVATTFPGATSATLVSYLRGDRTNEISNGGIYRDRSSILGDIVNSSPLITSGKDDYGWATLDPSYSTFLVTKASRPAMVYAGANEGMLHAFDAQTGVEQFGFIPNGVLDNMGDLGSRFYPHRFYVDGDPVVTDAKIGGAWSTVLVGTTAAGGRSVFALNVDNPAGFTGSDVLWELTSASDGDLGNTFGRPVVVPLESGGFGAIFGNGYGNNSNDPFLYVVDIGTGNVIAKLAPNDGNTGYNGLGQIAVVDANGNGKADTVYGADLQGNVWKFDIASPTPASWNVAFGNNPLFTATDAGGVAQPITSDLEVASGPTGGFSVFFGTGRYFAENDNFVPAIPQIQTLYSVSDVGTPAGTRANLVQQKITAENLITLPSGVVARSRQTTRNPTNFAKRGFYMDLGVDPGTGPIGKGEMFIGNPRIQSGKVFFTTFEPVGDPCSPGGRNWIYGLDLTSGGAALQNVQIDSSGTPACTGNCGALAIADGAPITDTSIFIPRPNPLPGLTCDPADPTCLPPATLDAALQQCTLVIRAPGSPPLILPRPCGRQSWRQVR
ncbi:MAG: PilC/PilY family type IV pilus protein, partial [Luteimonas sp.]